MGKVETNKKQKNTTLLQTSFELFTEKGFTKTNHFRHCKPGRILQKELSINILKINMI